MDSSLPIIKKGKHRRPATPIAQAYEFSEVVTFGNITRCRAFRFIQFVHPSSANNHSAHQQVDTSSRKRKEIEIVDSTSATAPASKRKRKIVDGNIKSPPIRKKKIVMCSCICLSLLVAIFAVFVMVINAPQWRIDHLHNDLRENIYGQDVHINTLIGAMDVALKSRISTIFYIGGPTGVGKSHLSSLIMNSFPHKQRIHVFYGDLPPVYSVLNFLPVLIVVEDANSKNIQKIINSAHRYISKDYFSLYFVFVFYTERQDSITDYVAHSWCTKVIRFDQLSPDDIRRCVNEKTSYKNFRLNEKDIDLIVNSQMKYVEEAKGPIGCKSIESKISRLLAKKADPNHVGDYNLDL